MKVCLVSQEYPPESGGGGIGTQTYLKAHGLSARGHDVHVVSAAFEGRPRTYADRRAIVHRIAVPIVSGAGVESGTTWLAYSAAVADKLTALDEEIRFDIIQFPEYGAEGFVYQVDTFPRRTARYVVQLHGPLAMLRDHVGWPERGSALAAIGGVMERSVIGRADKILASSHNTARYCAAEYGCDLDAIDVIHSAVDTRRFTPMPQPAGAHSPRVLFVGNLVDSKGFSLIVKAVLQLRAIYPDILLRAIGKGQYLGTRIDREIRAAGADDHVDMIGYVPHHDLPLHYAWCDVMAGASTFEPGPGNTYLEAMACGRPVIACDSGGAPEVVLHDETGVLIPPRNVQALIEAIARLADDHVLRDRLGAKGRHWIESRFAIDPYIDRVEAAYERILAKDCVT
jgi:glycosyltransferase involved in cell wall biosynthesis